MTTSWKIARRARACASCGRGFAEGEAHFSLLRLEGAIVRLDRCAACFQGAPASPAEFYWKTRFARDPRRRLAIDVEALREAFTRMPATGSDPGLRYLLALLLTRKRVFRLLETRRGEGGGEGEQADRLILSPAKGSRERLEVVVPAMTPERVEELRSQLRGLLGIEEPGSRGEELEVSGGAVGSMGDASGKTVEKP
ncbi:MAG TPA: hypothetical protein VKF62_04840 [Planctomycetota bacterium]|nr:hypothetical protein [Planctomycetota bacterium]